MFERLLAAVAMTAACMGVATAQNPIAVGAGSYASFPPTYKASTPDHNGFSGTRIEGRVRYIDNPDNLPVPTNDWWTDVIASRYSGALWSLPQMLHTGAEGVRVSYPTYWNENGTEVKSSSSISVGGRNFSADATYAHRWGDWDVVMRMPSADGHQEMKITMAHGIPFTWIETEGMVPQISFSAKPLFFDKDGQAGSSPRGNVLGVNIGNDLYGLYLPDGAQVSMRSDKMVIEGEQQYVIVALLNTPHDLATFEKYAYSVPRQTRLEWNYEENRALIHTSWTVTAENLRKDGEPAPVLQGFLPHAYKNTTRTFAFDGHEYLTPRGTLKLSASDDTGVSHTFRFAYRFDGMMPYYATPKDDSYSPERMKALIDNYAANGNFGADTYWGGKGLTQMALNMTFAKQTGNTEAYEISRRKLREVLVNWLTYTPGEEQYFFAYMPSWGSLLGFDAGYDSESFNDHHFHYGYFTYAAALLCLEDEDFAHEYGPMLTLLAKDYANWDRSDTRFPFLRTLDPWVGHSYAGGLGDAGNDNGNGQESSSEAMQGWGGVYLLGVALGDKAMRDAGIFGYMTESNGVAEYWFDRDHIYPDRTPNYDYTKYQSPYNTNITCKGIGWWTWFSGDPLWMHSIQWMPVSPCLNYLSKDLDFARWDVEKMFEGSAYQWFTDVNNDTPALAKQSVGNVVLCYLERSKPQEAAQIFDRAYDENFSMARATDTGHISYYVIHHHLTYGDLDFTVWSDSPTANAYRREDGQMTYMVYNPDSSDRTVRFYRGEALLKTVKAPAGLTVFTTDAEPTSIRILPERELTAPRGTSTELEAILLDQYGAQAQGEIVWELSTGAPAELPANGILKINTDAAKGSRFTVTASSGNITAELPVTVNDKPTVKTAAILPALQIAETGYPLEFTLDATDQYGNPFDEEVTWNVSCGNVEVAKTPKFIPSQPGVYTITATIGGKAFSHRLTVAPQLANLARNKKAYSSSEENAGTLASYATDDDLTSRWGSAHTDNEWIYVDLGQEAYITRVAILWEAAFASSYEIQLASGSTQPTESQWVTAATESASSAGEKQTNIGANARFVRMRGLTRGSQYGYSLLDFRVHGVPASASDDDVVAIFVDAPAIMDQHSKATLSASTFTLGGVSKPAAVTWTADKEATITGNDFTPTRFGVYNLTATMPGGMSSSTTIRVCETPSLTSLNITPASTSLIVGDSRKYSIEAFDQFQAQYPIDDLKVTVLRNYIPVLAKDAYFDTRTMTFKSNIPGNFVLDFNGMAQANVSVCDITAANLASGHPAFASSATGETADKVNDGDAASRWESQKSDNQWIAVDLEHDYLLNRARILWEGAFAADYRVQLSLDGENWADVVSVTGNNKAGWAEHSWTDLPARYIRVQCDRRATEWGFSIFELEVYGSRRLSASECDQAPKITEFSAEPTNGGVTMQAAATHPEGYVTYNFEILRKSSGGTVSSAYSIAKTGEPVTLNADGMYRDIEYEAHLTVSDLAGNTDESSIDFVGERSIEGQDLALGKDVTASSYENAGTQPEYAVDGNEDTRWGSLFNDGEWITVDLAEVYPVNAVEIVWDNPAYATDYDILTSLDGDNFTQAAHVGNCTGGTVRTSVVPAVNAHYVRVVGNKRATQYGTSIHQLRVYGDNDLYKPVVPDNPADGDDWSKWDDWNSWGEPGEPEDSGNITVLPDSLDDPNAPVDVYTTSGALVRRGVIRSEATRGLLPGLYIVGNRKIAVR